MNWLVMKWVSLTSAEHLFEVLLLAPPLRLPQGEVDYSRGQQGVHAHDYEGVPPSEHAY